MRGPKFRIVAALLALALVGAACSGRDDDDSASTDDDVERGRSGRRRASTRRTASPIPTVEIEGDKIKLVSSFPQSGATAAFSQIARGWKAYFQKVNEDGGVEIAGKKYTIETEDKDDEYNPATTAQNIDELVGTDGENAFAAVQRRGHGQQPRHPRPARRAVRAQPVRGDRLAGCGQRRLPVDDRLVALALHARGQGVRRPARRPEARRHGGDARPGRRLRQGLRGGLRGRHRGHRHRGRQGREATRPAPARCPPRSPASPPPAPTPSSTAARCWPAPTP